MKKFSRPNPVGILGQKRLPTAAAALHARGGELKMVAQRHRQAVGGIEVFGHVSLRDRQGALNHARHLLFGSRTASRNGLLHASRGVFRHRDFVGEGGGEGDALRPAELEHGLNVLAKKGRLYRQVVGSVALNEAGHPVKDLLQLQRVVLVFAEMKRPHFHQLHVVLAAAPNDAVAHDGGARVDAKDDALGRGVGLAHG